MPAQYFDSHSLTCKSQQKRPALGQNYSISLLLFVLSLFCSTPVTAAQRIYASYAVVERSISVAALEAFAKEGKMDEDLSVYAQYATPEQLQQLREILLSKVEISPITVSQFFYTPQGEVALERLGQVIQTGARQESLYALRSALILAAADPEGLTLLNVLHKFPTEGIRIDLKRAQRIAKQLQQIVNQTQKASEFVNQLSATAVATNPNPNLLPIIDAAVPETQVALARRFNLWDEGDYRWDKISLNVQVRNRPFANLPAAARVFPVDVYLPASLNQPAPVIVISHGLGSDRQTFAYLAEHLASHGFAVAVPQHPGSDAQQLQALINGTANEVAEPTEFVYRPLDVKNLLDTLESDSSLQGLLNLQQVGVIGQSFGGYTALALAGAGLNFDQLTQDCAQVNESWNISLLLQCRVLELPRLEYNLSDPRIKAAIAINPVDSSVLGQSQLQQIQVPVMMMASGADTAAPALLEQIRPFTWLTTPEKYLVLINNGTHFSTLAESDGGTGGVVPVPSEVIGPSPALARRYVSALSLAFFETYLENQDEFRPFLSPTYAQILSREPLPLSLIQSLTSQQLDDALD